LRSGGEYEGRFSEPAVDKLRFRGAPVKGSGRTELQDFFSEAKCDVNNIVFIPEGCQPLGR